MDPQAQQIRRILPGAGAGTSAVREDLDKPNAFAMAVETRKSLFALYERLCDVRARVSGRMQEGAEGAKAPEPSHLNHILETTQVGIELCHNQLNEICSALGI